MHINLKLFIMWNEDAIADTTYVLWFDLNKRDPLDAMSDIFGQSFSYFNSSSTYMPLANG